MLGEDQFGFKRGKGARDATGMPRIISEQTSDMDEGMRACFILWQKALECVNWTKLMQILKVTGIDWHKLYMDQCVKLKLDKRETGKVKIGRVIRRGCCLLPIVFNL
jgi:hypothetical protein